MWPRCSTRNSDIDTIHFAAPLPCETSSQQHPAPQRSYTPAPSSLSLSPSSQPYSQYSRSNINEFNPTLRSREASSATSSTIRGNLGDDVKEVVQLTVQSLPSRETAGTDQTGSERHSVDNRKVCELPRQSSTGTFQCTFNTSNESFDSIQRIMVHQRRGQVPKDITSPVEQCQSLSRDNMVSLELYTSLHQNKQETYIISRSFAGQKSSRLNQRQSFDVMYQNSNQSKDPSQIAQEPKPYETMNNLYQCDPLSCYHDSLNLGNGCIEIQSDSTHFNNPQYFEEYNVNENNVVQTTENQGSPPVFESCAYGTNYKVGTDEVKSYHRNFLVTPHPARTAPSFPSPDRGNHYPQDTYLPSISQRISGPVECVDLASDDSDSEPIQRASTGHIKSVENVDATARNSFNFSPSTSGGNMTLAKTVDERHSKDLEWDLHSPEVDLQFSSSRCNTSQCHAKMDANPCSMRWGSQYSSSEVDYSPRTPGWNIATSSMNLVPRTPGWNFSTTDVDVSTRIDNYHGSFDSGSSNSRLNPEWFQIPQTPKIVTEDRVETTNFDQFEFPPATPGGSDTEIQTSDHQYMPPPERRRRFSCETITTAECNSESTIPTQCVSNCKHKTVSAGNVNWNQSRQPENQGEHVERVQCKSPCWNIPPPTPGGGDYCDNDDILNVSPPNTPVTVDSTPIQSSPRAIIPSHCMRDRAFSPEVINLFSTHTSQSLDSSPQPTLASANSSVTQPRSLTCEINECPPIVSFDAMDTIEDLPFISQSTEEVTRDLVTPPPMENHLTDVPTDIAVSEITDSTGTGTNRRQVSRRGTKRTSKYASETSKPKWDTSLASLSSVNVSQNGNTVPFIDGDGKTENTQKQYRKKKIPSDDEELDETWRMPKRRKPVGRKQKRKKENEIIDCSLPEKKQHRKTKCSNTKKSVDIDLEVLEMRDEYNNDEDDQDYFNCSGSTNYTPQEAVGVSSPACEQNIDASTEKQLNDCKNPDGNSIKKSCAGTDGQKEQIDAHVPNSEIASNIYNGEKQNPPVRELVIEQMPIEINCGSRTLTLEPGVKRDESFDDTADKEEIVIDKTISNGKCTKFQNNLTQNPDKLRDCLFSEDTILREPIYSQGDVLRSSLSHESNIVLENKSDDTVHGILVTNQANCSNLDSNSCNTVAEGSNKNGNKKNIHVTTDECTVFTCTEKQCKLKQEKVIQRHKYPGKETLVESCRHNIEAEEGEVTGEEENVETAPEEDSPHEAARMRRRQLAAAFIMQEAEEGDAAEDDDDDWLDDGDGDEASEAAAAASAAEARRRRQLTESWRPLRAPSPSVSDILKRLRLGTSEDGGSIARARAAVPREEPDQQALLPGVSDPCLWMVQCCRSQERHAVLALMRKALRCIAGKSSEQLRIHSVVYSGSAPRYVYIEALRKQHAQAAIHDVASLRAGRYRAKQVPVSEMPDVLKACRKVPLMRRGQWVRPKRGIYRDDVAQVVEVDPAEEYAVVRLLPRIDYSLLAPGGGLKPIAERAGPKRRRTPARRLDIDALRRAGVDVSAAAVTGEVLFNRDSYKDGFLVKRFPLKALTNARPTLEEAQTFGVDPEAGLLLSEDPEPWLGPGDDVEVKEGGLEGLRGKVLEIHSDTVTVKVDDERIQEPVICAASELTKDFKEGDKVRVVTGAHRGATGLVVKAMDGKVFISEDETNREIEALVRHVRLAMNSAPAEPAGGLRWADMVTLRDGSVGMVERVEGTSVRVMDAQGRLRAVDARTALLRGPHTRCRPLLDCEQNEIRPRDAVEVVEGPHKGARGTVKGAYRGCAFIAGDSASDGRLFVARATHLRLQGGASDRCRMFLRQLDPDAAAEAAISVGVRGATQPASPVPPDPRRRAAIAAVQLTPHHASITALGPPPPPPPLPSDARRADFDTFDRGLRRDRTLLGAVVIVTAGAYKGSVGTVRDASLASARVELYTPQQTIPVKREHLKVIEAPSSITPQRRTRVITGSAPSPTRQAQFSLGGFYGTSDNSTPRAPSSPRPLPTPGFNESPSSIPAGYRTPMWGVAATPMYDAGSRTPLPTPQSPAASAAVWEARTTPGSLDSSSPMSHGFLSLPLVYPPSSTPVAPPVPLPLTWPVPGIEVTVSTAPGLSETATVRAVTRDGGITMMMRSGTLVTLATSERVRPSLPSKGETCIIVGDGPLRGRRVLLANIDGADGVIRLENCMTMQLIPMAHLCRLAEDEESPFHAVETPVS